MNRGGEVTGGVLYGSGSKHIRSTHSWWVGNTVLSLQERGTCWSVRGDEVGWGGKGKGVGICETHFGSCDENTVNYLLSLLVAVDIVFSHSPPSQLPFSVSGAARPIVSC